ncbi:hypothetical protein [Lactococcus kimchii]|uniref:hypothetical protein n=1 Tax=Lactococcus sp. S-13 TaxID=2507158 RepID=UPI0010233423|nr:hypothetical protein [Lactococcus sp. S-13]RZI49767.1 hypothetical protein EQJ87_10215 [Lactococcus sp. S-13]
MIDKKFEDKLKNLRELYLDKRSSVANDEKSKEMDAFMALTDEEKVKKIRLHLKQIVEKLTLLDNKLTQARAAKADKTELAEIKAYIDAVKTKKLILEQKLKYIETGEFDATRKEKIKRQLADLELKRCKALLGKKDCSKIEEKIALKKDSIKRLK